MQTVLDSLQQFFKENSRWQVVFKISGILESPENRSRDLQCQETKKWSPAGCHKKRDFSWIHSRNPIKWFEDEMCFLRLPNSDLIEIWKLIAAKEQRTLHLLRHLLLVTRFGYTQALKKKTQSLKWHTTSSLRQKKSTHDKSKTNVILIAFFDYEGVVHHELLPARQTVNDFLCTCKFFKGWGRRSEENVP